MTRTFKNLRILIAVILPVFVTSLFLKDLIQQLQMRGGLDGPLAHYTSYTFAFNRILLASFLSIVLLFDFKLELPAWGKPFLRVIGLTAVSLSILGLFFLVRQMLFMGGFQLLFIEVLLLQIAYFLISMLIVGIGFNAKWVHMNVVEKHDA